MKKPGILVAAQWGKFCQEMQVLVLDLPLTYQLCDLNYCELTFLIFKMIIMLSVLFTYKVVSRLKVGEKGQYSLIAYRVQSPMLGLAIYILSEQIKCLAKVFIHLNITVCDKRKDLSTNFSGSKVSAFFFLFSFSFLSHHIVSVSI